MHKLLIKPNLVNQYMSNIDRLENLIQTSLHYKYEAMPIMIDQFLEELSMFVAETEEVHESYTQLETKLLIFKNTVKQGELGLIDIDYIQQELDGLKELVEKLAEVE